MIFRPTRIEGAWVVDAEPVADERGHFARTVCVEAFARHGLDGRFVQQGVSRNTRRGILRGLHFQRGGAAEDKLVRVTAGVVHDVIVDLRPGSHSYLVWEAFELSAASQRALYVPKGVAHGFQTLTEVAEVFYQMTVPYDASAAAGVRWDDPALGIEWPVCGDRVMSEKDRGWPTVAELVRSREAPTE